MNGFDPTRSIVGQIITFLHRINPFGSMMPQLNRMYSLGQQVRGTRKYGMRWEFLIPLIALIILAGSLLLKALAPTPPRNQPSQVGVVPPGSTAQPNITATGYPAASNPSSTNPNSVTPGVSPPPGIDTTATATFGSTVIPLGPNSGYPNPGTGPEPIGQAPGGVPSVPDTTNPPAGGNPISVPTPALIAPTTAPVPPTTGYPTPQPQQPQQPPAQNDPEPTVQVPLQPTSSTGTQDPAASPTPEPTPTSDIPPTPEPTLPPPTPTSRPSEVLSGNLRWTVADSPKTLDKDYALVAGSSLTIDPGVEVRVAPGVQFTIGGTLRAQGSRFVATEGRWEGIAGTQGSTIILDQVQIRQAGQSGTAVSSTGGTLVVRNSSLSDNGGGIVSIGSSLDLRNTQISGNAITGPAVNVRLPERGAVNITNNIVGGNGTPAGGAQVLISAEQPAAPFAVEGNLLVGGAGVGMIINTAQPLSGTIRCNSFDGGTVGLQLAARRADTAGFNLVIDNNAFERQTTYGATGTLAFNVSNNWWSDPSGPRDAGRNPEGRGVAIGVNLQFQPWLAGRAACAPTR
ncbi:MAG TPA: right-handed parallel beta-helix repeat-containing protein [Herpetosiphonaceae bacterium]